MQNIDITIIDYLELMTTNEKFGTRNSEISSIIGELDLLAKRMSVPIVLVKALNKIPVVGENYWSNLSYIHIDISIPETICFPHRPDFYNRKKKLNPSQMEIALCNIAKSPCDKTAIVTLKFYPDFCKLDVFE